MASKSKKTIAEVLNLAQVAINNSLKDPYILKLVSEYGYTAIRLKQGQALLENAKQSVNLHAQLSGAQQDTTAKVTKVTKEAHAAYQALAKVSRAIWLRDRAMLETLGIKGAMPKTTAGFLQAAYTLFDNAQGNADSFKELAEYGYTKAKLAVERKKIEAYDSFNQLQEAAKGTAQDAAKAQLKAMSDLNDWMARYVKIAKVALRDRRQLLEKIGVLARSGKTKKQRGAPAKAKATRAARRT
ncbi:MAG: hypothetical protein EG825_11055 [Rhodocyclaceae bacterium]|nr:hypothetical protein [Rhodocyclaceae bacterium]